MGIIIRIDVDRAYGRKPLFRHLLSRCSSDFSFPRIHALGYLDLKIDEKHLTMHYPYFWVRTKRGG